MPDGISLITGRFLMNECSLEPALCLATVRRLVLTRSGSTLALDGGCCGRLGGRLGAAGVGTRRGVGVGMLSGVGGSMSGRLLATGAVVSVLRTHAA